MVRVQRLIGKVRSADDEFFAILCDLASDLDHLKDSYRKESHQAPC